MGGFRSGWNEDSEDKETGPSSSQERQKEKVALKKVRVRLDKLDNRIEIKTIANLCELR
ncbi:Gag-pol polyprotein [Brevibacillus sp. IT-7CA2]